MQARSLDALPIEVLGRLVLYCTRQELKDLRLTCKIISHEATRRLFATTYLGCSTSGAEKFLKLREQPYIERYMRTVYLKTIETEKERYDEDRDKLSEGSKDAFLSLATLPNIDSIGLIYSAICAFDRNDYYWGDPPSSFKYRLSILELLTELCNSSTLRDRIRSLSIFGLQNINDNSIIQKESFKELVGNLRSLSLKIISEDDDAAPEHNIECTEVHEFIAEMPSVWLTSASLTRLVLYSDHFIGFCPALDWRKVSLPKLQVLALGNHTFSRRWQLDWILSLSETLEELYLDDCKILYAWHTYKLPDDSGYLINQPGDENWSDGGYYGSYSDRWHQYFDRFSTKLEHLREFRFGSGEWRYGNEFFRYDSMPRNFHADPREGPYMAFEQGVGPSPFVETLDEEDDAEQEGDRSRHDDETNDESNEQENEDDRVNEANEGPGVIAHTENNTKENTAYPKCLRKDRRAYDRLLAKLGLPTSVRTQKTGSWTFIPSGKEE